MTNSLPWKMAHIEIDGVPIKHVDLPWLCLITKWYIYIISTHGMSQNWGTQKWMAKTETLHQNLQSPGSWILTPTQIHGSLNVPIEHHPTIRYMVYNGYYKVMSNIPKMGQLPTPAKSYLGLIWFDWVWVIETTTSNIWGFPIHGDT